METRRAARQRLGSLSEILKETPLVVRGLFRAITDPFCELERVG